MAFTTGKTQIVRYDSFELPERFISAWETLVADCPMRGPTWMKCWWEHFQSPSRRLMLLLGFDDNEQLVGVLPAYVDQRANSRVLRLLGDGVACTDHIGCFARPESRESMSHGLRTWIQEHGNWSRLQFEYVDADDPTLSTLWDRFGEAGYPVHFQPQVQTWQLPLETDWEAYLSVLSKSHRKRCRKLQRVFFESGKVQVHETKSADEFTAGWDVLLQLHADRWGSAKRPLGSFSDRRFVDFHHSLAQEMLKRGQLRLAYLTCDDMPIAAEYQFIGNGTLYAYQSGMTEDRSELQPGNLSLMASIQFAIHHGLQRVDFLRGDEPYKAHWRASPRPAHEVRVWQNTVRGRLFNTLHESKAVAINWLKNGFPASEAHGK